MSHQHAPDLIALRHRINVSQANLSHLMGISRRSVIRWETSGEISDKHLSHLLGLAARPIPQLPVLRGRPGKTWTRVVPDLAGKWPVIRYWLWRPGHSDHTWAIVEPPTAAGDSWTEKTDVDDTRVRYALDDGGTVYQVEIIEGYAERIKHFRKPITIS